jgi:hypothetical protein
MNERAAGDVRSVLRKAPERPCVELFSQRRRGFDGGNLGLDGRHVDVLLEAGDEFEAYRLEPEVDVMGVNRVGVGGARLPDACNRTREETQHASHALEIAQGTGFLGEHIHQFRVQRIASGKLVQAPILGRGRWEQLPVGIPQRLVGGDDRPCFVAVDAGEQPSADDLDSLVVLGGIDHRRLAGGDALGLGEEGGDVLCLAAVGVGGFAVTTDR